MRERARMELEGRSVDPAALGAEGITVVRTWVVKRDRLGTRDATVVVDYEQFGIVDRALRFTRFEGRVPHAPVKFRRDCTLSLAGPASWTVTNCRADRRPHVGVDAAIRIVTAAGIATRDAAVKANASRTVNTLRRLAAGQPAQPDVAVTVTPYQVLFDYCTLDGNGAQLTAAGAKRVAAMFASGNAGEATPHRGKVIVVDGFALSNASIGPDGHAEMMAEHIDLVTLDPATGRVEQGGIPPGGLKIRTDVTLVLTGGAGGIPPAWKITGTMPMPRMTVDAAIRHVTTLRDTTTSNRIRQTASRGLASLKLQRR
jgi:hypothetical protein